MIDLPPLDHAQAIATTVQCGIPRSKIRVFYDRDLQSDVIHIAPLDEPPSRETLRCIFHGVFPAGYVPEFEAPEQNNAFWTEATNLSSAEARIRGEAWLRERGLFDRMPRYRPNDGTPEEFARAVETYCGLEAGSALQLAEDRVLSPRPDFLDRLSGRQDASLVEKYACLTNVLAASNLAESGLSFGFIGHEAFANQGDNH